MPDNTETGADGSSLKGWPYTDFATGWYQIGYSSDFAPGTVKPGKWLNQDLVIFRTESGKLVALDAYCPHMGAHMGHVGQFGGKVCGETIQCPWHGWRWNAKGENAEIPYMPNKPSRATVPVKHIREVDGFILFWYDWKDAPPSYEWPGLPFFGDRTNYYPIDSTISGPHRIKPQMPFENSADPHHFPYVHGSGVDAEFGDYIVEGALIWNVMDMKFGAGKPSTWMTPNGPVDGTIDSYCWGTALGIARFNIEGRVCVHATFMTPIDHESVMFFSTVTHTKELGDTGNIPKGIAKRMMDAQHIQIRHDVHIWENMRYRTHPIFTGDDERTRYAFVRKHLDQFYPNPIYGTSKEGTSREGVAASVG